MPNDKMKIDIFIRVVFIVLLHTKYSHSQQIDVKADHNQTDDLIFAHIMCQHGDRNIGMTFDHDPNKDESKWPGGYSQLTNIGRQQHYQLGKYLRNRYGKLIGDQGYSKKKVYVRSTDTDRTIESALSLLAGLFPPQPHEMWEPTINWQPIAVHTVPLDQEYLLFAQKLCDRLSYELEKSLSNDEHYKSLFIRNRLLVDYLSFKTGIKSIAPDVLFEIFNTLHIENLKKTELNLKLEAWAEHLLKEPSQLQNASIFLAHSLTNSTELQKLRSGFLLKELLDRFTNKTTRPEIDPDRVFWMYFTHGQTIIDMLNSLGLFTHPHLPPYASCIFFDLYKSGNENYVQIVYKKGDEKDGTVLNIPDCGIKCPLKEMYALYDKILPQQSFEDECKIGLKTVLPNDSIHFMLS